MSKLFFGGVPTRLDVDNLMKEFDLQGGETITYEAVETVIGVAHTENRFRSITTAWRKRIFREKLLQSTAEDGKFFFLTADQAQDFCKRSFSKIGRAAGRHRVRTESIDGKALTTSERLERQNIMRREAQAMYEASVKSIKAIAAPKPVTPSPRLVAKG